MTKKIAVIGSGIAGLTCAYSLAKKYDVIVFEAENYTGGHTHTVEVENDGETVSVDTGFIVFNDRTYPNFIRLIQELKVPFQPTEMSFSVRNDAAGLEYNGNTINTLFAQRTNIIRPLFLKMIADILRFNREVRQRSDSDPDATIGKFLEEKRYSLFFRDNYLLPMISAIWSMGLQDCYDFPLQFFTKFFDNHGLLDISNRPQWYTIVGGSSSYIGPLTAGFRDRIRLNSPVTRIERKENRVFVSIGDNTETFDEVILACHGDQALAMLADPAPEEKEILGQFQFTRNDVILHTDTTLLPRRKKAWASWNYTVTDRDKKLSTLTYNMNILQRLQTAHTYLVSLNQEIRSEKILDRYIYSHPVYSMATIEAQKKWHLISGKNNTHYCGAYWRNGFHEDGVYSALRVSQMLEAQ